MSEEIERDPRIHPREGDILRLGTVYGGIFFEVLEPDRRLASDDVPYIREGRESAVSISTWKDLMTDAEVIRTASEQIK